MVSRLDIGILLPDDLFRAKPTKHAKTTSPDTNHSIDSYKVQLKFAITFKLCILKLMKIKTHSDLINLWPSIDDLSRDINVKYNTVYAWSRRGQIPSMRWNKLIKAAKKRGYEITLSILFDTSKH